jgi:hypothetical protein
MNMFYLLYFWVVVVARVQKNSVKFRLNFRVIEKKSNIKIEDPGCSTVWSGCNVGKCFLVKHIP